MCYNPYLKQQLAASDYDGALSIWDTQQVKCIHSYQVIILNLHIPVLRVHVTCNGGTFLLYKYV